MASKYSSRTIVITALVSLSLTLSAVIAGAEPAVDATNLVQSFPVGPSPWGLTFDGANIWTASLTSPNVTKLRASDGALLGTFEAGGTTAWAAFDGENIWVTNFNDGQVSKLRASDGVLLDNFVVGFGPSGIISDGNGNVWVRYCSRYLLPRRCRQQTQYWRESRPPSDGTILGRSVLIFILLLRGGNGGAAVGPR